MCRKYDKSQVCPIHPKMFFFLKKNEVILIIDKWCRADRVWMFPDNRMGLESESQFLLIPDCHALVSFQSREFPHLKIIEQKPPKMIKSLVLGGPLDAPPLNI